MVSPSFDGGDHTDLMSGCRIIADTLSAMVSAGWLGPDALGVKRRETVIK